MPDLQNTRRKLKTAFIVLGVVDVVAAGVLLSPIAGSPLSRRQQMDGLWKQLQQETRQVEPLRGMDKKIDLAQREIDTFYKERLPERDSEIFEALGKVAANAGVQTEHIKSKYNEPTAVGLIPVELDADLSGNYLQLVRFVNSLERDQVFFIVKDVELAGQQGGVVKLQIKLETFLKAGAV